MKAIGNEAFKINESLIKSHLYLSGHLYKILYGPISKTFKLLNIPIFVRRITKEGVLLRNVSPSLVLSDHFSGGGILELGNRSGKELPFMV